MDDFFSLSPADRRSILERAADQSGRPAHLLEKDIWVVWTLSTLFEAPASHLVFKGGTSLSKAYNIIRRFSEDVDLTYDIHAIAPDLVGTADDPLPQSGSQERRWTRLIRARLREVVVDDLVPLLAQQLEEHRLNARARAEGDRAFIDYDSLVAPSAYVRGSVMLEFGARSTGEPHEIRTITCDAAKVVSEVRFPVGSVSAMRPERTFWEKATAIHVFCHQGRFRGRERFSRHWHDLSRLDRNGYVNRALADRGLAHSVARHKAAFFPEKDHSGNRIDYAAAVDGNLQLAPEAASLAGLAEDYAQMLEDGLLLDDAEPFEELIEECRSIQQRANDLGG